MLTHEEAKAIIDKFIKLKNSLKEQGDLILGDVITLDGIIVDLNKQIGDTEKAPAP